MYPGTHARTHPDRPAVIAAEDGTVLTYRDLDDASMRLAQLLYAAGLRTGQHIAFLSNNRLEVYGIYWAALRSGLYVTAINHHLSADEAAYIVNDCGAEVLIVSAELADLAVAVAAATPTVRLRLAFGGEVPGYDSYEDAVAKQPALPLAGEPRGADMLYSSGTTGRPKGIKPPLPEVKVDDPGDLSTLLFGAMYSFDEHTVYYSAAPIYHAAPLRFSAFIHSLGGTVVMARQFEPRAALEAIQRYRITHSQWVPTMFVRMLKLPDEVRSAYDVSSMKVAVHAAAPCPIEVKRAMMDWWGPVLYEYYSSTEGNGVSFIGPQEWLAKPGSVGKAGLGTIRICDDSGAELPIGQTGVIYFERDTVAFHYHNDDDRTESARHPDHELWTTTGDIGYIDEEGYLFLTDRKAFMIISGGVNIYPQEIEDCLTMHPSVLDVAVIGIPDDEMGEQVCAVVQVAPGFTPGEELATSLKEFVRSRIAHYKTPRVIDFVDALPRSAAGKLVKRILKQRYASAKPGRRLPILLPAELDDEQRLLRERIVGGPRSTGPRPSSLTDTDGGLRGPFNAMLYAPSVGEALQALGAAIRYGTAMSDRVREIAILTVAAHWDSEFERYAHEAIGRSVGLSEDVIAALRVGAEPPLDDPTEQAVLRAVRALLTRSDLDDAEFADARDRLGLPALVELSTLVGYYATLALQLRIFRVTAP